MKKKILIVICLSFSFLMLSPHVKAVSNNVSEKIRSFVYTFDDLDTQVSYVRDLKDVNGEFRFQLYEIIDAGYAIIAKTNSNIVDIKYGELPDENMVYYLGPNTFTNTIDLPQLSSFNLNSEDINSIKVATDAILEEDTVQFNFIETPQTFSKPQPTKPSVISGGTEIGIADSRMNLFTDSMWIVSGDSCGAYMGAAMISYMDKYFGGNYFIEPATIDSSSSYATKVIARFKQYISGGATSFKVINTLNSIMYADYPTGGKSAFSTATESTYKSKISGNRPVILFLASWKPGNTYGGHFVLAYRYVDYQGALWFKAYDGWPGYSLRGWINRNWIENGIYLN